MKAVRFRRHGGPEVLEIFDAPVPEPKAGEILIKMASAGISRPDHLMRTGTYPWTKEILPFYPGLYGSGYVEALGEGVEGCSVGQPVYVEHPIACGCYSQYKTAPVSKVTPIPEGIDMDKAAIANSHLIVWGMLTECFRYSTKGQTLYIKGAAGGIGTAVMQIAPILGMKVIASASTEKKCEYLRGIGTGEVFRYTDADEKETVLSLTEGRGADIIMDQSVGEGFISQMDYLADMGTILVYNNTKGFPSENVIKAMTDRFGRCPSVRVFSFHYFDDKPELLTKKKAEMFELLSKNAICPHIGGMFDQKDVVKAHELLDSGNFFGSIVLHP